MSMTRYAIEKDRVTFVALAVILVTGIWAFLTLPQAEDPGFTVPTAFVMTYFPGGSPTRIEQLVTDKLEKKIQQMPEIDYIESTSKTGVSLIYVTIQEKYKETRPIWDDLRRKIEDVEPELPDGVIGPIVNDEFGDVFGTIVTITGDGFAYSALKDIADEVRNELLLLEDTAKVRILGAQEERIFIEYHNARLAQFGLSPSQMQQLLESRNILIPGGHITNDSERLIIEPSGNFESLEDIRQTVIFLPQTQELLFLKDIAEVSRGYVDPPTSRLFSTGKAAVGLAISMRDGGNITTMGRHIKALIERVQQDYPIGIAFDYIAFQPDAVERKVDNFIMNLVQSVVIVILVMIFSLGLRTGMVVATLIPMAILMSLACMAGLHIGLDQVSIASLIIALGMLVDNAIVMSESIMVQMQEGKKAVQAAVDSARELRFDLLTSSLTTSAAFLPIFLAESIIGEYTSPLFKVVTLTLLSSWLLAVTMTPLLCVRFLKPRKASGNMRSYDTRFYNIYRTGLLAVLRHPFLILGAIAIAGFAAVHGFGLIQQDFMPPNDKAICTAEIRFPLGTPIERTQQMVAKLEAYLKQEFLVGADRSEGIRNWGTFVGKSAPRFVLPFRPEPVSPEYAMLLINATSRRILAETIIPQLERYCHQTFPDGLCDIALLQTGPPVDFPIVVRLSGRDHQKLFTLVDKVKQHLNTMPGVRNIHDDWGIRTKKILVKIDPTRARRAGVTNRDVAISLQTIFSGLPISQYREEDTVIPIVMRAEAAERDKISELEGHQMYSQATGNTVPLKQIADIEVVWELAKILRRQRLRTVAIKANVAPGVSAIRRSNAIEAWLQQISQDWEFGYHYEMGGDKEQSHKANRSIMVKVPLAGLLILMLLIIQFNSIRKPLIIGLTIPLGLIGVVTGLLITGASFTFMTLLGIISLSGIVMNNAIVLLDRIGIEQTEGGYDPRTALIEAAQRRLRPILLTTVTTIGGLIPLWIGGGPLWETMAIAIIFGLLFATILTLGVIPVLYALLFNLKFNTYAYSADSEQGMAQKEE
ncbi:MMPL family transporter [candidate division KSB3 bacterium]|uniref:MMPL family transporter n=1 Tax=candidate division KSB3 bacterium TaxID=2044937 RepID=A0A9D5JTC8_9BACT|nr:MMPL family transporter [candidate division KSB3 bacterium]MBD3323261.1 MMPL family transporter [candidate division KSB3 bacterium]